ncbi:SGNH/GDSL hydrolase family protein [Peribacillus sp. SCS-155]|uniref:SGNH/GDSL hydrolase family protein n=1 Tax=Peribacillus sedimenti TaxID=3115297 RepID=UPI003906AEB4
MGKAIIYLLLSTLFLSACTQGTLTGESAVLKKGQTGLVLKESVPASFFPEPVRVVSIGDSLTEGVGDSTNSGGYLPYLKEQLEKEPQIASAEFLNYGVRGNTTSQLLDRLEKSKIKEDIRRADSVVITIGGNDIMKVVKQNFTNLTNEQFEQAQVAYERRLSEIMDKIRSYNSRATIYLIGVYNPFSKWMSSLKEMDAIMAQWNSASEEIVSSVENAHYIEIADIFEKDDEDLLFTDDYFHPNDRGYEMIAGRIYTAMDENQYGQAMEATAKGDEE